MGQTSTGMFQDVTQGLDMASVLSINPPMLPIKAFSYPSLVCDAYPGVGLRVDHGQTRLTGVSVEDIESLTDLWVDVCTDTAHVSTPYALEGPMTNAGRWAIIQQYATDNSNPFDAFANLLPDLDGEDVLAPTELQALAYIYDLRLQAYRRLSKLSTPRPSAVISLLCTQTDFTHSRVRARWELYLQTETAMHKRARERFA
jgi:hypothetical protein